ncbi:Lrp/AsnC family transcriptional regulator [Thalassospira alkalitolerans]|uniref:Lrp/AsnC family transcriptional regulator n=1 Tax=Thalassospira alkalitolerans TaxID=1293890 RepID=UPI001FE9E6E8|nr:Lrp/AsnC family transcriptional regulator [Thalassospira alkalitolerans]|tara:strand:+ start:246189 stop:246686 length:498 start_codon:yes stop_codon:yes gene_type:complete
MSNNRNPKPTPDLAPDLSALQIRLIEEFQRDFPTTPRPFATIAEKIGSDEESVITAISDMKTKGYVDRVGATYATGRAGASTLAAMEIPQDQLEKIANLVSHFTEINHNYEREDKLNLWFVVTAADQASLNTTIHSIEAKTGFAVHRMPMIEHYRLDLGFALQWN